MISLFFIKLQSLNIEQKSIFTFILLFSILSILSNIYALSIPSPFIAISLLAISTLFADSSSLKYCIYGLPLIFSKLILLLLIFTSSELEIQNSKLPAFISKLLFKNLTLVNLFMFSPIFIIGDDFTVTFVSSILNSFSCIITLFISPFPKIAIVSSWQLLEI